MTRQTKIKPADVCRDASNRLKNCPLGAEHHGLDCPRVRFNWGYHDAARDFSAGRPRVLSVDGKQNLAVVSRAFDAYYFDGYRMGLRDAAAGEAKTTSEPAWTEYRAA